MSWITRLRDSLWKTKLETQLDDELQFHLEMRTQEFVSSGMTVDEARRKASRLFGNSLLLKERTRDMDTIGWIETVLQDFRYAFRLLRISPGFTVVAVVTLALGIGANTAIFSLMNAFVLRPLRLKDPDQLVMITETKLKQRGSRVPTMAALLEWKKHSRTLQDIALAGFFGDPMTISGIGHAERISSAYCGENYFDMLGVKALRGRTFLPGDDAKGSGAAIISASLWERTFGADPNILGQKLTVGGSHATIIGVLPPTFSVLPWKTDVDMWLAFRPGVSNVRWISKMGRLKAGVSMERAQTELNAIAQGMGQHMDADSDLEHSPGIAARNVC